MPSTATFSFCNSFPSCFDLWDLDGAAGGIMSSEEFTRVYNSYPCVHVHDGLPDDVQHWCAVVTTLTLPGLPHLAIAGPDSRVQDPSYIYWKSLGSRLMKLNGWAMDPGMSTAEVTRDTKGTWAIIRGSPFSDHASSSKQSETTQAVSLAIPYLKKEYVLKNDTSLCWASNLPDEQLKLCKAAGLTCALSLNQRGTRGGWNATADKPAFFRFLQRTKDLGVPVSLIRSDFLNITAEHQGDLEDGNEMLTQPLHPDDHDYFIKLMHKTMSESLRQGGRALAYLKDMNSDEISAHMKEALKSAEAKIDKSTLSQAELDEYNDLVKGFSSRPCDPWQYTNGKCTASSVHDARFDIHIADDPTKDRLGDVAAIALEHPDMQHLVKHIPVSLSEDFKLKPPSDNSNLFLAVSEPGSLDSVFKVKCPRSWEWFGKLAADGDKECKVIVNPGTATAWNVYTIMANTVFSDCLTEVMEQQEQSTGSMSEADLQKAQKSYESVLDRLSSGKMTLACQDVFSDKGWQWHTASVL